MKSSLRPMALLAAATIIAAAVPSVAAARVLPTVTGMTIQTNGPTSTLGWGDWYTHGNSAAGNGYHYFELTVPCGWPAGQQVHVDLFSAPMHNQAVSLNDEPTGATATTGQEPTVFELYDRTVNIGTNFATPGPGAAGSLVQTTYTAEYANAEYWDRLWSINGADCGEYLLRAETTGNDQNGWQLRFALDDDSNPATPPPANADNPDGVAGTGDELHIGTYQTSYAHSSSGNLCETLYEYVDPSATSVTMHNYDMDGNGTVLVTAPSGATYTGTLSGNARWNGSANNTRVGDTHPTEVGWWSVRTCINTNNQFIQELQSNVPAYAYQTGAPNLTVDLDDGQTVITRGQANTYTVTVANVSDVDPFPGAADDVAVDISLPAGMISDSCAVGSPATGTCSVSGSVLTITFDQVLPAGGTITATVDLAPGTTTTGPVVPVATLAYEDTLNNPFPTVTDDDSDTLNEPPVAVDDTATTDEDTPAIVDVLTNDSDPDTDTVTITNVTDGTNGTATISGGDVVYTPNANFFGSDTVTYTISDGNGGTDTATVTVTVNGTNDPPVAVADAATTDEDTPVTVDVLANDSDVDSDTLTVVSTTQPTNGTTAISGTDVIYTPDANFNGLDTFTYDISDGNGGTDTATVTVAVTAAPTPPPPAEDPTPPPPAEDPTPPTVEQDDPGSTPDVPDPSTASVDVTLAPDTTVVFEPPAVVGLDDPVGTVTTQPENGTLQWDGSTVTYTPGPGYVGSDVAIITYVDGGGNRVVQTITFEVSGGGSTPHEAGAADPAPAVPAARLPATGADASPWATAAFAALLFGSLMLWFGRMRRTRAERTPRSR